jgi:hypothetical protein
MADTFNPNCVSSRPSFGDNYDFSSHYNSGNPYHGAVSYGGELGVASFSHHVYLKCLLIVGRLDITQI